MKNAIKSLILCAALALPAAAANSYEILSVDIGIAPNIDIDSFSDQQFPNTFALNLRVADPLAVGFETVSRGAGTASALFNFKYDLSALGGQLAAVISLGNGSGLNPSLLTTTHAGIGFEYTPFYKKREAISTALKIAPRYIFDTNDAASGVLVIGIAVSLGI
ncbi:MAG: hypothetical protein LBE89_05445 [Helicobacteraceae bacterium]|jgi:hypothetical protein|nr:hypothetical protein [Helicobacteraceae bacterium]